MYVLRMCSPQMMDGLRNRITYFHFHPLIGGRSVSISLSIGRESDIKRM